MKRQLQALAFFLLLGIVKLPADRSATQYLQQARLLTPPVKMSVRDKIGQMGFVAALGGLRSLVASITYLQAYEEWKMTRWAKVDSFFQLIYLLQPRYSKYWEEGSWHMAYNAASSYQHDMDLRPDLRTQRYREYVNRGIEILQKGLEALPEDARLWTRLAEIYERRANDPRKAAECYMEGYRLSKSTRLARFACYQYAQTTDPELWKKGFDLLKFLYGHGQRQPTLINVIKTLEERLHIPVAQRIPEQAMLPPNHQDLMGPNR